MSKDLFSDILYVDTYLKDQRSEVKFKELLPKLDKEYKETTPTQEIRFPKKAFSAKLKYYEKLIDKTTATHFNEMISELDRTSTNEHLQFLYQKWHNRFVSYLINIQQYIQNNEMQEKAFVVPGASADADHTHAIFYLKANAILLFLELQERFNEHSNEDILTQEQIHELYFKELPPQDLYVVDFSGKPISNPKPSKNVGGKFNAIKADLDFRIPNDKILTYAELVKQSKADALARLEERLVEENLIDNKYSFIDKRGNKQVIAAFLLSLFEKGYFNERIFPDNKPSKKIERKHITKFFAHRYGPGSNADKEYRNFEGTMRPKYDNLLIKHPWLDQIS
ncbi:hypothetical protein BST97_05365 [Nonlabens spongiae]|uniref:Uncharacterized protein n=1 Tax=Nonlabens spongiae TaxID=331648 RepID=A0A1W6MJ20_9FLAO|nr:DUF6617 family protein [Nonlabens spongiae]ARN77459.1 hypothetical protein BST97_05365 [Nonlabens spongiae]